MLFRSNTFQLSLADALDTRGSLSEVASTTSWSSVSNSFFVSDDEETQSNNMDTRMAMQPDYTVVWLEGDNININGTGYTVIPKLPATIAEVHEVTPDETSYKGCHPNIGSFSGTTWNLVFPSSQTYGTSETFAKNVAPAVGYATAPANHMKFYNTCGILKVPVKSGSEVSIDRIRFTANEKISGAATVNINSTSPNMVIADGGLTYVEISFTAAVTINPSMATNLYFVLPPNT